MIDYRLCVMMQRGWLDINIYMVTCSFTVFHGFWINNRSIDTVLYDTMLLFFLAGFLTA